MNLGALLRKVYARATGKAAPKPAKPRERRIVLVRYRRVEPGLVVALLQGLRLENPSNASRASSRIARAGVTRTERELGHELVDALARSGIVKKKGTGWRAVVSNGKKRRARAMPDVECVAARVEVRLVRVGRGMLDEDDNLRVAFKAVKDGVTDALGFASDRDPRIAWLYAQERAKDWDVRIEVRALPAGG